MSAGYFLNFRRRFEQMWAAPIQSLGQFRNRIIAVTERALQRTLSNNGALTPIPVRAETNRRRFGPSRD